VVLLHPRRWRKHKRCTDSTLQSDHVWKLLRDPISSRHRPAQNDTTIYHKPETISTGITSYLHFTRIASRYSHQVHILSSDRVTLIMDEIDTFFASFPTFRYRRNASSPQEFQRMCRFFGWRKHSNDMYPIEREEANTNFRIAMVRTFNQKFGEGVDVKRAWIFLCTVLGVEPMPNTITDLKEVS
jgi:hypothetical protein